MGVLLADLLLELLDQLVFVSENFVAGAFLSLDVLSQFLAVLFLLKLLPVPIDLDILLMRLDDLVLDFVSSLLFGFLFAGATVFVQLFRVRLNLNDLLLGPASDLFKGTFGFLDLHVAVARNVDPVLH